MPMWGVTYGFGFRPYWNDQMHIKDQDGEIIPIPREIQEITEIEDPEEMVDQAIAAGRIIPMEFSFTAKADRAFMRKIRKEVNRRRHPIRDVHRKKERFRRAVLKYGTTDDKAQLALLLYTVAIQRLMIWKEEAKHGYSKVPERSRT